MSLTRLRSEELCDTNVATVDGQATAINESGAYASFGSQATAVNDGQAGAMFDGDATAINDCVRYVARGGTLQPRVTVPTITGIEVTYSTSGFEAGTTVFVVWSHPEFWNAQNYSETVEADGTIGGVIASQVVTSCVPSSGSLTVKTYPALEVLATASYTLTCPA